ncbi:uncharacterized protein UV8b_00443 [Ustilaginoidea virens]|uniref:DnaJ homologue subfamily C member 28 conserved domain-containing protein n=1 Tax=Ustilaginoidea virens TaxID=1159556 RepID=A0A063BUP1_USTVR|nr:uncharacterized protein UV8b_00443 [Ustilaginoidea virens]QUC16202.1 hypothetical protein UV8b_00443 [Ustilaginoidea virens]GAO15032.1 hypothetical protein UVI_02027470 [Ustilaginoidea virens]
MPTRSSLTKLTLCRQCGRSICPVSNTRFFHPSRASQISAQTSKDQESRQDGKRGETEGDADSEDAERGAMTRRLEEATEEALLAGGASGRRALEDAGFSEALKEKLLKKMADANSGATKHAGHGMQDGPASAAARAGGQLTHLPSGSPWTGTETTADAVFRMLNDAKKPLKASDRGGFQILPVVAAAADARMRRSVPQSPGQRAASARDKANAYVGSDLKTVRGLSDEERKQVRAELRERFEPAARAVPASLSGLAALANQRIEDAIARGQFRDLPRGKETQRDARAGNPFIDTTEYLMNKMIQRQEIVPPWIEKQQELTKAARVFRERLRNDWKRHASRTIASRGGSLQEQMKRAEEFAAAEAAHNARRSKHGEQIEVAAEAETAEMQQPQQPVPSPFRDADWERAEQAYMKLSVQHLNSLTRSYNLTAPELAKKPYFSLERELSSCYADVAPLVANEIKARAVRRCDVGPGGSGTTTSTGPTMMEKLSGKDRVRIHLEAEEKAYGLKEWWRDFWKRK